MIAGINFKGDGSRYISTLIYCSTWNTLKIERVAQALLHDCDEVYIISLDGNYEPFINEIVLKGCRVEY